MKLRRFCENTWEVRVLDDGEPCPATMRVLVGHGLNETIPTDCGRTDHVPLDDQSLCGVGLGADERCTKPLGHEGAHASDIDFADAMLRE